MTEKIFNSCVDLLIWGARLLGMTYKEINVLIFCIIWPILTLFLIWKAYIKPNKLK